MSQTPPIRTRPTNGRIPVAGPWVTQKEIDYVTAAASGAWFDHAGDFNRRFEQAFAASVGCGYAVSLPSCTSALHLALAALDLGEGDEVIVPDITWIATAAAVRYVGATPVFADVDPVTWCLSADALDDCITERTRAAIAVDLYGGLPDWDALHAVADARGLVLLEDAAEAIGAEYKGRKAGSMGRAGTFSFHGTKTLTTGEGGMLVTDEQALYDRVRVLADHGREPGDRSFLHRQIAFKYKMSSLQAAFGLAQLERLDEIIDRKRQQFDAYRRRLGELEGVTLNAEPAHTRNTYWMVTAVLDPQFHLGKEELIAELARRNIDSRPFFYPLSSLPAFGEEPEARRARQRNHVSYRISPLGINLPSSLSLTDDQIDTVCDVLIDILAAHRQRVA